MLVIALKRVFEHPIFRSLRCFAYANTILKLILSISTLTVGVYYIRCHISYHLSIDYNIHLYSAGYGGIDISKHSEHALGVRPGGVADCGKDHFRGRKSKFRVTALNETSIPGEINESLFVNSEDS